MSGAELKDARLRHVWTQLEAAQELGVTQAYLSMVERGKRPVSVELAARAMDVFKMSATSLPLAAYRRRSHSGLFFKHALGALGYPGFAYLGGGVKPNPAELLMESLDTEDLDARVIEALPWLPVTYPEMDWDWLMSNARLHDRQNRLAFVLSLSNQAAGKREDRVLQDALSARVAALERSRLAAEDTLCKQSMTNAERKWLRVNRPPAAKHWNLLTDLALEQLDHDAYC